MFHVDIGIDRNLIDPQRLEGGGNRTGNLEYVLLDFCLSLYGFKDDPIRISEIHDEV